MITETERLNLNANFTQEQKAQKLLKAVDDLLKNATFFEYGGPQMVINTEFVLALDEALDDLLGR